MGRRDRRLWFYGMGSAGFRVVARHLRSADLRWIGLENGRTVPRSRRRADRDPNEDPFFHPYSLSHANSLQNCYIHAHSNSDENAITYPDSDSFHADICYCYSLTLALPKCIGTTLALPARASVVSGGSCLSTHRRSAGDKVIPKILGDCSPA